MLDFFSFSVSWGECKKGIYDGEKHQAWEYGLDLEI